MQEMEQINMESFYFKATTNGHNKQQKDLIINWNDE